MSKITNPTTEPSVTCGFFNSVVGADGKSDRLYNAEQMSSIFSGLINDGVFASIGDTLVVKASSGNTVSVGTGKCWFNGTWTRNDDDLLIECDPSETLQTRIDAIIVQVNKTPAKRDNYIMYKKGIASQSNPTKPTLTKSESENEYALCYITRKPGSTAITQADIENAVGTDETPFVTSIVQVTSLDKLLGQWTAELDQYMIDGKAKLDRFIASEEADYDAWYADMKVHMQDVMTEVNDWTASEENKILTWFDNIKGQLSTDPALNLQMQIDAKEIERLLIEGLPDGTKTISDDGTVIVSEDTKGRILTKTFTDNFLTITSVLKSNITKNYLPYPYVAFNGGSTVTKYGVTFTNNGDGTITANGTATEIILLVLPGNDFTLPKASYSLSGCPVGGSEETYYFGVSLYNNTAIVTNGTANDVGYGATLDTSDKTYTSARIFICIKSGVTVNNLIFNPKVLAPGAELGRLVKHISSDGKTIESTLTNYSDTVPNLVEIERGLDTIIATENSYIGGDGV